MTPLHRTLHKLISCRCLSTTVPALKEASSYSASFKTLPAEVSTESTSEDELTEAQKNASLKIMDPFESVPLRKLANYLGETFSPKLEEMQENQRQQTKPRKIKQVMEPPEIPHFLPLSRWAAKNPQIRETLIVEEKRTRPRLSWYHPDDTMVPRGWLKKGLLEDIFYYRPFLKKKE